MSTEYKASVVAGGKPLPSGGIFLSDGLHYVAPFNNQLRVYFMTTRQCIRSIKFNSTNNISLDQGLSGLKQDTTDSNLLWVFLTSGDVLIINWKDKTTSVVVKDFKLYESEAVLKVLKLTNDGQIIAITGKVSNKAHTKNIVKFTRTSGSETEYQSEVLASVKNVSLFNTSNNNNKLVFITKSEDGVLVTTIDITNIDKLHKQTTTFSYKQAITSLAINNDSTLAIGLQTGVIHLIQATDGTSRLLKWHIDQVSTLSFTNDSNYLLSGGLEKVLVFWNLESEKQQFLPRLNGDISSIDANSELDDLITLTLKLDSFDNYEVLVLSTVDLQSRLAITGPRHVLNSELTNMKKLEKIFTKSGDNVTDLDLMKLKYDFTSTFKINPLSKNLYFINDSTMQVYDMNKNEQIHSQKVTDSIPTGKVKSELKIKEAQVKLFEFTHDGNWLCTVEEHRQGDIDNLLSKNDFTYVLKIWKLQTLQKDKSQTIHWELITKIINPHGVNIPVTSVIPAPESYAKGVAFLTADNNAGVRLWRQSNAQNERSWSLRKMKASSGVFSNATSLTWSQDTSLILLGFDDSIVSIDVSTFEEIELIPLTKIAGSRIRHLQIIGNDLIILSGTSLKSVNLITLAENELVVKTTPPKHGENLISVNEKTGAVCYAVNFYNTELKKVVSKIFVFDGKHITPNYVYDHDEYVCSVNWNHDIDFVFIDLKGKLGIVTNSRRIETLELQSVNGPAMDYEQEMTLMLQSAQSGATTVKSIHNKRSENADEENEVGRVLDVNSFGSLFENIQDGIKLETLFERVMQVIS